MNTTDMVDVTTIPRIQHKEAMQIAAAENEKFATLLRSLTPDEWSTQTECTLWDVRAMVAHVVGSAAGQASPKEFIRQKRAGKPIMEELGSPFWWDGMNELQVHERAGLSNDELIEEWDSAAARALKSRTKLPRVISGLPVLKLPPPVGRQKIRYLFDVGFTRDVWMHRVDIAFAIGRAPDLDVAHDGRILADIVAEWAGTHGEPFVLTLDGPGGGTYRAGTDGEDVQLSVVEFARVLAERSHREGVMCHPLPL